MFELELCYTEAIGEGKLTKAFFVVETILFPLSIMEFI